MINDVEQYCVCIRQDSDGAYIAVLKPEYAVDGMRVLKSDGLRTDRWVTINGAHVIIGKGGVVTGGAGGRFNGKKISDFAGKKKRKLSAYKGTRGKVKGESDKTQTNSKKTSLQNLKSLPKFADKNKENKYKLPSSLMPKKGDKPLPKFVDKNKEIEYKFPDATKEENSNTKWRQRMKQMSIRRPEERGYLTKEQLEKAIKKAQKYHPKDDFYY